MTMVRDAVVGSHLHPGYRVCPRTLRVISVTPLTPNITHFRLAADDGSALTPYRPGSHLIVTAGEHRNAYSLLDDGMYPTSYGISVLRRGHGQGSDWLHDNVDVGDTIEVEGPRSMFGAVLNQRHALLVAGGIGVTPVLSHARAIARAGGSAEIVYSYRPGEAAHLSDIRALAQKPGISVFEATTVDGTRSLLAQRLACQPLGTHAYACGPPAMLDTYLQLAEDAGWPELRVHLERFTAPAQDPGAPFHATLASSGQVIEVPSGVSLLQRLLDSGVLVPNLCRQGVCGECRIPIVSGAIEHRDLVLTDDEKSANDTMLCCVSRGQNIEVAL